MRTILTVIIMFMLVLSLGATNYYVSSSGSDANKGTTTGTAWQTLAKVNASTFMAGDNILFNSGDTFLGALIVQNSGTSTNRITYGAYGSGAKPILSGFETISNWTKLNDTVWTSRTKATNALKMVTVNGVNTPKGRYPKKGYLTLESHSGLTSITDNQLTGTPNWTGAEVYIKSHPYRCQIRTITNQTNSTITYDALESIAEPENGNGYFLQNDIKALDSLGDWCIKDGTLSMYFGTNNPANFKVKASMLDNVITIFNKSYISIDGLNIQGANLINIALKGELTSCNITNCGIGLSGGIGVNSELSTVLIENCDITSTNGTAIYTQAERGTTTIKNNTIKNIAVFEGMGTMDLYSGLIIKSANSLIEYNTIRNVGYNGILFHEKGNITIRKNLIDTFCTVLTDGGGVYTSWNNSAGNSISNNIIINGLSSLLGTTLKEKATIGIYLDDNTQHVQVSGNSVANIEGYGIFLHTCLNNDVINNVVFNASIAQMLFSNRSQVKQSGINMNGNTFVAKTASQYTLRFGSTVSGDLDFGSANNNIYARPINDTNIFLVKTYNTPVINLTFEGWKKLSGFDSKSTKSPVHVTDSTDIKFYYNASSADSRIVLPKRMIDLSGQKYYSQITLAPYTSVVLLPY